MNFGRGKTILFTILITSISLLSLALFILSFVLFFRTSGIIKHDYYESTNTNKKKYHRFGHALRNNYVDESSLKMDSANALILGDLENNGNRGFVSYYHNDDRNMNFFSDERMSPFRCTGSCYCDEESERRVSFTYSTKKMIVHLIVAVSSIIAYNLAFDQFEKDCENVLIEDCPSIYVKSEVDKCEQINEESKNDEKTNETIDINEEVTSNDGTKKERKFLCLGKCLHREFLKKQLTADDNDVDKPEDIPKFVKKHKMLEDYSSWWGCHNLVYEKEFIVDFSSGHNLIHPRTVSKKKKKSKKAMMKEISELSYVKDVFMFEHLNPYCADMSSRRVVLGGPDVWDEYYWFVFCVGYSHGKKNQSIKCEEI